MLTSACGLQKTPELSAADYGGFKFSGSRKLSPPSEFWGLSGVAGGVERADDGDASPCIPKSVGRGLELGNINRQITSYS